VLPCIPEYPKRTVTQLALSLSSDRQSARWQHPGILWRALKSLTAKAVVELTGEKRFLREKPDKEGSIHQVWQSFKAF
jgi:hypothetical protein